MPVFIEFMSETVIVIMCLRSPPKRCDIWWWNFACRPVSELCNTWDGSDVDRCHHWEENLLFKDAFHALQRSAARSRVVCGWLDSGRGRSI